MMRDILIVDDEADIRAMLSGILQDEGFSTREAKDGKTALLAIEQQMPHLVVLDIWLEGSELDGLQILEKIMSVQPLLPVVMISGHGTIETAISAIKQGAYDFIEKPFKSDRLLLIVKRAIETAQLWHENQELRNAAGLSSVLHGISPAIAQVRQTIRKVAPSQSRVLITGPSGSGKEVAARMIHRHSKRMSSPFVVVNCAAMHPDRMETELFGIEQSAVPVGTSRKIGFFEQADGGTLLLDEIVDMPLETQGKIVRVLQEQSFERVGGTTRLAVDVRVLATSAHDLNQAMANGHFREDLYYRLNVVPLRLPPLRERRDDIPILAAYFMEQGAKMAGTIPRRIGEDAMATLQACDWPGNVRQLRNVIDWLLIMVPGDFREPIRAEMLPTEIGAIAPKLLQLNHSSEMMTLSLREARELFERDYLMAQIMRFNGNVSRTAEFIGMERSALHRKLKSLGVNGDERPRP